MCSGGVCAWGGCGVWPPEGSDQGIVTTMTRGNVGGHMVSARRRCHVSWGGGGLGGQREGGCEGGPGAAGRLAGGGQEVCEAACERD